MAVTVSGVDNVNKGVVVISLTLTAQNDTFVFSAPSASQITMQGEGISAGDLTLQASNDGANYYAMPTATSLAVDGLKAAASSDLGYRFYRVILETASESVVATLVITSARS